MKTASAYEDISDEESSARGEAVVCRVSCHESGSDVLADTEEAVEENETLVLNEELKEREINIIRTLLTKNQGEESDLPDSIIGQGNEGVVSRIIVRKSLRIIHVDDLDARALWQESLRRKLSRVSRSGGT